MPELPEVETTRRGITPHLRDRHIASVVLRQRQLRWPVPDEVAGLRDAAVAAVTRRAKFLLVDLPGGQMLMHLGMSGTLRVLPANTPPGKHDHADFLLDSGRILRFNDPRRFGALLWTATPGAHPLLDHLGPEPLGPDFDGALLYRRSRGRKQSIKTFIMDNRTVVGVGNIYAQESLFLAGIHPSRPAGRVSAARYDRLAMAIRDVLTRAIAAGGTTLRDFSSAEGKPGYFSQALAVYGRDGLPCQRCGAVLRLARHGQRSTTYCAVCQT
ncbi:bifunctional DNA-formamidopyrimidine glycosylase/DNA-(apurinic or apyrimidinic site) lyase [Alcanivorax sp. JB21]|uniref:bifunctional DNA-formamidopyrimidine glycosylase/DNA-(apurinic or apyrimidinic site) lyase n=1 Tax=Alcanivorax limicola TaxID=2874102 RepID=UPI001CC02D31|nr:bifunctional DNA-formamidopyrimidine glycosylase/DNA-(apurinic or apyrimidinic site) lyase [Alcanivorax limicola]MBZ2189088.1 bifunctional DNA-formamidopyrimidine glycosylase/DNA-(apurinic or apyrimidinic site) lyase [Alcanivorax limicola]